MQNQTLTAIHPDLAAPWRRRAPMQPTLSLLGHSRDYLRDPHRFLVDGYKKHGPVYRIRLAHQVFHVLNGPEAVNFVTRNDHKLMEVDGLFDGFKKISGSQTFLLGADGDEHTRLRKIYKKGLSKDQFVANLQPMSEIVEDELKRLLGVGAPLTMQALRRIVYRQLGILANNESAERYFESIHTLLSAMVASVMNPLTNFTPPSRGLRAARSQLGQLVDTLFESRHDNAHLQARFLQDIASAVDNGELEYRDLMMAVLSPYFAGIDTVASTVGFFVHAMIQHPEIQQQLMEDLPHTDEIKTWDAKDFAQAKSLRFAVMETLRLYPVSTGTVRRAKEEFEFGGYTIRRRDRILIAHVTAHFLPEHFHRPDRFDPTRFAPPRSEHRQPGVYAPYGAGVHTCLGAGLAEVQMMLIAALIVKRYHLTPETNARHRARQFRPFLVPEHLRVRLQERSS